MSFRNGPCGMLPASVARYIGLFAGVPIGFHQCDSITSGAGGDSPLEAQPSQYLEIICLPENEHYATGSAADSEELLPRIFPREGSFLCPTVTPRGKGGLYALLRKVNGLHATLHHTSVVSLVNRSSHSAALSWGHCMTIVMDVW